MLASFRIANFTSFLIVLFSVAIIIRIYYGDPAIEFRNYIANNVDYPEEDAEEGIHGRVLIQFTVDSTGIVRDPKIVRGVSMAIDDEAIRVVL